MIVTGSPPAHDCLEFSIFGNGNGESIVVHLGNNKWMLVDSFIPNNLSEPIAIHYLKSIGVNIQEDVKLIVATHWHDDHVRGMSDQLKSCSSAEFVFSQALETDEFRQIVGLYSDHNLSFDNEISGVKEFAESFKYILSLKQSNHPNFRPPTRTQSDLLLYNSDGCQIYSLSPSPTSVFDSEQEFWQLWNDLKDESKGVNGGRPPRASIPKPKRNHNAIVLWIKRGDQRFLLGADLEEDNNANTGWQGVLKSKYFPDPHQASIFKIAHHGSPNGDHPPVWNTLVAQSNPLAVVTAYNKGVTPRPSVDDIKRIRTHTNNVSYTSLPTRTANHYERTVERTIQSIAISRKKIESKVGHVQIRCDINGNISHNYAGAAGVFKI